MKDIELVIKIPKVIYESCKKECEESDALIIDNYTYAIGTGTPLPKGHGRLISAEKMEEITGILINGLFRDGEIMYCEMPLVEYDGKKYDLRDIVATLHNYLYEAVKGKRYNYMFHWANKVLADCDDDVFEDKEIEKEENTAR